MLNRRNLFGASAAAVAIVALPAAVQAATDPWDDFIKGLDALHPRLGDGARRAQAEDWDVSECYCVSNLKGCEPGPLFLRVVDGKQVIVTFTKDGMH